MERLTERKRNFNGTAISKKSMIDREGYPTVSDYASKVLTKLAAYEDAEEHEFPLIDRNLSKEEVHGLFERTFSFPRPKMYDMGYPNNNCIGCVKGGMGYWNRIRKDFPEVFESRAQLERLVGYSILKDSDGTPLYLDELDPNRGDMNTEIFPDCGIMCYLAQK